MTILKKDYDRMQDDYCAAQKEIKRLKKKNESLLERLELANYRAKFSESMRKDDIRRFEHSIRSVLWRMNRECVKHDKATGHCILLAKANRRLEKVLDELGASCNKSLKSYVKLALQKDKLERKIQKVQEYNTELCKRIKELEEAK